MDQSTADAIRNVENQLTVVDDRLAALEDKVAAIEKSLADFVGAFQAAFAAASR